MKKKIIAILSAVAIVCAFATVSAMVSIPVTDDVFYGAGTSVVDGIVNKAVEIFHEHKYSAQIVDATCTDDGYTINTCDICGNSFTIDFVDAHGHDYEPRMVFPTCTSDGHMVDVCKVCNDEVILDTVPAIGHLYGEWEVTSKATATTNGIETRYCHCGEQETREYVCVHTNTHEEVVVDATCTVKGTMNIVCDECTKVIDVKDIAVTEHVFGKWVVTKKATPEENGIKVRSCSCGKEESANITFNVAGNNSIYIPSANINVKYVVAPFTQAAVDKYDVICNYNRINEDNPIVLGHNTGSLKKLYNTNVGSYIYFFEDGVMSKYKVVVSERAIETKGCTELEGLETGYELFDSYSGDTVRLYTCYQDKELGKIRWIVCAEKVV